MLAEKIINGDVRATARLIRLIDDADPYVNEELQILYRHARGAHIVGFTGSPGVGKSTLVDQIVSKYREHDQTVGVLAVDPTSPFTGGAILGDRVRMQKHFLDDGVFIRSMATRGSFGGLTRSTADAIVVLDAMGKDAIIVETVGVGQDEVDIVNNAHTTVLVSIPGMGDDIQAIKAGLMEIGDIFVVNKADREGAAKTVKEIRFMLSMSQERREADGWIPPIIQTIALERDGVDELFQAIGEHRKHLQSKGGHLMRQVEQERIRNRLLDLLRENLMAEGLRKLGGKDALQKHVELILDKKRDPYAVSIELVNSILGGPIE